MIQWWRHAFCPLKQKERMVKIFLPQRFLLSELLELFGSELSIVGDLNLSPQISIYPLQGLPQFWSPKVGGLSVSVFFWHFSISCPRENLNYSILIYSLFFQCPLANVFAPWQNWWGRGTNPGWEKINPSPDQIWLNQWKILTHISEPQNSGRQLCHLPGKGSNMIKPMKHRKIPKKYHTHI